MSGNTVLILSRARINLHSEILSVIIFYSGNYRLHKFQENYQVHVDTQLATAFHHRFDDILHHFGMPAKSQKQL